MRYSINWSADRTSFHLVLEAQNDEEDEILRDLYFAGSFLALGETGKGRAELVLATSPVDHRRR